MLDLNLVRALHANVQLLRAVELWQYSQSIAEAPVPVVFVEQVRDNPAYKFDADHMRLVLDLATDCRRLFKKLMRQLPDRAAEKREQKLHRLASVLASVGVPLTVEAQVQTRPGRTYLALGLDNARSKSAPHYAVLIDMDGATSKKNLGEEPCTIASSSI